MFRMFIRSLPGRGDRQCVSRTAADQSRNARRQTGFPMAAQAAHFFRNVASRFMSIPACLILIGLPGCSGCHQSRSPQPITAEESSASAEDMPPVESKTRSPPPRESEPPPATPSSSGESETETASAAAAPIDADAKSAQNPPGRSRPDQPQTPAAALARAQDLREKARRAAERKDYGAAFALDSQAWEATQAFPADERLKRMAVELADELEAFGDQANARDSGRARNPETKLIEK